MMYDLFVLMIFFGGPLVGWLLWSSLVDYAFPRHEPESVSAARLTARLVVTGGLLVTVGAVLVLFWSRWSDVSFLLGEWLGG